MTTTRLSIIGIVAGLLASAPAFAQAPTGSGAPGVTTVQKQRTDGGDSPANPKATDATAAAWHKQHTDGGDSPANPRAFQKSIAQSPGHSDPLATNGSIAEK
jgi:hypothetical protein